MKRREQRKKRTLTSEHSQPPYTPIHPHHVLLVDSLLDFGGVVQEVNLLHSAFVVKGSGVMVRGREEYGIAQMKHPIVVSVLEVVEHIGVSLLDAGDAHVRVTQHLRRQDGEVRLDK